MQFRLVASIVIFVGSYFPLSLILVAQDFQYDLLDKSLCWPFSETTVDCIIPLRNAGYSLTIVGLCLFCFLLSLAALATARSGTSSITVFLRAV